MKQSETDRLNYDRARRVCSYLLHQTKPQSKKWQSLILFVDMASSVLVGMAHQRNWNLAIEDRPSACPTNEQLARPAPGGAGQSSLN